jgi:NAD(P)-dependent dehydrogenase (short-subunit alcohol dehydrogenase family)
MSGRLEGKVAVITGGGNGIGRACCERFAEEGADIVIADLLDEPGEESMARVKERGRETTFVHIDASSPKDNENLAEVAIERFGKIDILVTAAGISFADYVSGEHAAEEKRAGEMMSRMSEPWVALTELQLEDWQRVIDVNLTGTMLACRAVAPHMVEKRTGSIVTIASIAAKRPDAGPLSYTVSKAGVWMLTKSLARSLGPAGVRVNAIGPGFIETNMTTMIANNDMIKNMFLMQLPLGRLGQPIDIANTALFLASDESSYFTGEILHPDGGFFTE